MSLIRCALPRGRRLVVAASCLAALVLSACSQQPALQTQAAAQVAPVGALIYPPPGGPGILGVVQTTFANAIRQEISLATQARTPGENKITIVLFKAAGGDGSAGELADTPLVDLDLMSEARAAWPQANMKLSPYYVQNDYGPFGYAAGRSPAGDTCVYAWQRIEPTTRPSGAFKRGAISVRLQLCDKARSEESLLGVMYQLRINADVFDPWRAPAQIGRIFVPIKPQGVEGFATVTPVSQPKAAPQRQPAASKPVETPVLPPGTPIVPAPGTSTGTTGPIVPAPPATPTAPAVLVPPPPAGAN